MFFGSCWLAVKRSLPLFSQTLPNWIQEEFEGYKKIMKGTSFSVHCSVMIVAYELEVRFAFTQSSQ